LALAVPQDPAAKPLELTGVARAAKAAALSAPKGLVLAQRAELGATVEAGEVVASFVDTALALEARRAEVDLALEQRAQSRSEMSYRRESENLELLRRNFDLLRGQVDSGRVTQIEVLKLEVELQEKETEILALEGAIEEARLRVTRAEVELELARVALDATLLRAPFAGVVAAVHLQPGERSGEGPVLELIDLQRLRVYCEVPSDQIPGIQKAGIARVQPIVEGAPRGERSFEGRVVLVEPALRATPPRVGLWLDLGDGVSGLWPGQACRILIAPR
ncbi:MAG: HlyD family efflux transporter periplasmic adaptor subunit, partial [Planctomycetes bacterium]|nr:HlyD family efflux transporter periplasmic adaptor subunit [Planctomycetota bacterium]